jgi:UDP-N-acetylglucosamine 4,6-dehydratase/5-epimerase
VKQHFKNKTILISGGTGSFGGTFTKYLINNNFKFKEIRIFSRDEKKQFDFRNKYNDPRIKFFIGDVREYNSVLDVMENVDYVFHAAALKQVPSCEFYPLEAVKTNIEGTNNILAASNRTKVKKVICLSTDKAVEPVNAMGMSKALMEKVIMAKSRNIRKDLSFCITRYGNVIGSRGSVIPTFINQIKSKSQLTITDSTMTRFMMSLDEAVELVLYAFLKGKNGDLFIKKSPGTSIGIIAQALIKYYKVKNNIKIIGIRAGEKKHEKLLSREEKMISTDMDKFFKINVYEKKIDFKNYYTIGKKLLQEEDYRSDNTKQLNVNETLKLLKKSGVL